MEEDTDAEKDLEKENFYPNVKVVKSKKKGKNGSWSEKQVLDMIDVICENESFQKKRNVTKA